MSVSTFDSAGIFEGDSLLPEATFDVVRPVEGAIAESQIGESWHDAFVRSAESLVMADAMILERGAIAATRDAESSTDLLTGGMLSANLVAGTTEYPGYLLRYTPGQVLEDRPAVEQWQAQMKRRGWSIEVDGLYGPQSERVAKAFQLEKGLVADGIVGPQTWRVAFDEGTITGFDVDRADSPVVAPVIEAPAVVLPVADPVVENAFSGSAFGYSALVPLQFDSRSQQFQQRLADLGWQIEADGLFGPRSSAATRSFQRQVGLDSDGIVGALTWAAVFADDAPVAPVVQSFDSPAVSGRINGVGLDLIKDFEGLRLNSYRDAVGVWTIGYGHTRTAGPGQRITNAQATALLREDVANFENAVTRAVRVPITENQFAALVSFAYNVGSGALNSSTLLRRLNAGDTLGAADEFLRWNRAGGRVLAGLTRRRVAERELFLS